MEKLKSNAGIIVSPLTGPNLIGYCESLLLCVFAELPALLIQWNIVAEAGIRVLPHIDNASAVICWLGIVAIHIPVISGRGGKLSGYTFFLFIILVEILRFC